MKNLNTHLTNQYNGIAPSCRESKNSSRTWIVLFWASVFSLFLQTGALGQLGGPGIWKLIANPGNPVDGAAYGHNDADQVGRGSVAYNYWILDRYITVGEYLTFLNSVDPTNTLNYEGDLVALGVIQYTAGTWSARAVNTANGNTCGPKPENLTAAEVAKTAVNFISFNQSARYANWRATGSVTSGAYTFASADGNANVTAINAGWTGIRLPKEDEWYKAAYWNQAGNTYNLYGTTSLAAGIPVKTDLTNNGLYVTSNGHAYDLTTFGFDPGASFNCFMRVQVGQGGTSAYGLYHTVGAFHDWQVPFNYTTGTLTAPVLRPDNQYATSTNMQSAFRQTFSSTLFRASPTFR